MPLVSPAESQISEFFAMDEEQAITHTAEAPQSITKAPNWKQEITKMVWNGGSSCDAWFTASTAQIAQVLLTLPRSFAQMGLASGIAFQITYALMGCWSCYMIVWLYADYRHRKEVIEKVQLKNHHIQFFEVVDSLLGPFWKIGVLSFSVNLLFLTATIQLIACGSIAYYLNDKWDKRTWTLLLGTCGLVTALIPTAKNYRICSSLGIVMTTYTAWYMTIASIYHGQIQDIEHTGPTSYINYFTGATNILFAFGGHAVTIEIMHPMKKPREYKWVYFCAVLYSLSLTIPSATSMNWAYGDKLLNTSFGLSALPKTSYRDAASVLMLIHQFSEFGMIALPINLLWEKLLGTHHQDSCMLRSASRLPLILAMWFVALMLPFAGVINSAVGALVSSVAVYMLPCLVHMVFYWDASTRKNSVEKPPFWVPSWIGVYCINLAIVIWMAIASIGLGSWATIVQLSREVHKFGLFAKCYQCHQ